MFIWCLKPIKVTYVFICEHFAFNLEIFAYICDGFALFCSLTERLRLTIRLQKFEIYNVHCLWFSSVTVKTADVTVLCRFRTFWIECWCNFNIKYKQINVKNIWQVQWEFIRLVPTGTLNNTIHRHWNWRLYTIASAYMFLQSGRKKGTFKTRENLGQRWVRKTNEKK